MSTQYKAVKALLLDPSTSDKCQKSMRGSPKYRDALAFIRNFLKDFCELSPLAEMKGMYYLPFTKAKDMYQEYRGEHMSNHYDVNDCNVNSDNKAKLTTFQVKLLKEIFNDSK